MEKLDLIRAAVNSNSVLGDLLSYFRAGAVSFISDFLAPSKGQVTILLKVDIDSGSLSSLVYLVN